MPPCHPAAPDPDHPLTARGNGDCTARGTSIARRAKTSIQFTCFLGKIPFPKAKTCRFCRHGCAARRPARPLETKTQNAFFWPFLTTVGVPIVTILTIVRILAATLLGGTVGNFGTPNTAVLIGITGRPLDTSISAKNASRLPIRGQTFRHIICFDMDKYPQAYCIGVQYARGRVVRTTCRREERFCTPVGRAFRFGGICEIGSVTMASRTQTCQSKPLLAPGDA